MTRAKDASKLPIVGEHTELLAGLHIRVPYNPPHLKRDIPFLRFLGCFTRSP